MSGTRSVPTLARAQDSNCLAPDLSRLKDAHRTGSDLSRKRVLQIDPIGITASLGFQTHRNESRHPWSKEEDEQLCAVMRRFYGRSVDSGEPFSVKWDMVASHMLTNDIRKGKDCRKRWSNSLDPNLRHGKWTPEEDERLLQARSKYGSAWNKVSSEINGRSDDQCAKRWCEVLDPDTKDRLKPWTREEDLRLIRMINQVGTKWKTISREFSGRPALTCRNRWRKLLTSVVRGKADDDIIGEVERLTNSNNKIKTDAGTTTFTALSQDRSNTAKAAECSQLPDRRSEATGLTDSSQWTYTLERSVSELNDPLPRVPPLHGLIKDTGTVLELVEYAKRNNVNITVHQHARTPPTTFDHDNNNYTGGYLTQPLGGEPASSILPLPPTQYSPPPVVPGQSAMHPSFLSSDSPSQSMSAKQVLNYPIDSAPVSKVSETSWPTHTTTSRLPSGSADGSRNGSASEIMDALDDDADPDVVQSFGMFYNIFTRGNVAQEPAPLDQHPSQGPSIEDAWGGGFDFIPFNPS